jgi:hypothetical protein
VEDDLINVDHIYSKNTVSTTIATQRIQLRIKRSENDTDVIENAGDHSDENLINPDLNNADDSDK